MTRGARTNQIIDTRARVWKQKYCCIRVRARRGGYDDDDDEREGHPLFGQLEKNERRGTKRNEERTKNERRTNDRRERPSRSAR